MAVAPQRPVRALPSLPEDELAAVQRSVAEVLAIESSAIARIAEDLPGQRTALAHACDAIRRRCRFGGSGRLAVTGIGKAGKIGDKLAATFASTGTPAFFLHPAEARHGDLGMLGSEDVVLALSNSGSSEEVVALLPSFKRIGAPVIAITGRADSPLGQHADIVLSIGRVEEACPLGLAPSTSTTAMLALGDAIALTVQRQRRFTPEDYARFHPAGALGRALMTCADAMRHGAAVAAVLPETPLRECLHIITRARAGSAQLVDEGGLLLGVFTDGDLRRLLERSQDIERALAGPVRQYATMPCRSIREDELLSAALRLCHDGHIDELPVVDAAGRLVGLIDLQDLAGRGFEIAASQAKG